MLPNERKRDWLEVDSKFNELLTERHKLLIIYNKLANSLANKNNFNHVHKVIFFTLLHEFCILLVDYTAILHLKIMPGLNFLRKRDLMANIHNSIKPLLDFSDNFSMCETEEISAELEQALSEVGEQLAGRMDLEDTLMQAYRNNVA